jgi:molybdopterin-guanine dinucleotide biosynthesis protein A
LDNANREHQHEITATIIAGGLGTRMNSTDKALLQWRGRPFIAHIIERLQQQVDRIVVNTNSSASALQALDLPLLPDPFPARCGPLAGILAGLNFSATPLTLFVPCDNPLLSKQLCTRLYDALRDSHAAIAYARCGEDHHYLYALMRSDLRDSLQRFLQSGERAVRRWYTSENALAVDFSDDIEHFRNFNTPADLEQLPQ